MPWTEAIGEEYFLLSAETIVKSSGNGFQLQVTTPEQMIQFETKHLVTTCGGYALASLLPFLNDEEIAPFNELKYAAVTQVLLGFETWKGISLKSFWRISTRKGKQKYPWCVIYLVVL